TLHSWPSASRQAATQIGPRGSTNVSISSPRMPPMGGFRNAIFMMSGRSIARATFGDSGPSVVFALLLRDVDRLVDRDLEAQGRMAEGLPLVGHVVEDDVLVLEDPVGDDVVLLQVKNRIVVELP